MGAVENPGLKVYEAEPRIRELSGGTCPRDGREGCAYVDVAPDPNAGRARHMLSYSWGYVLQDIISALRSYCSTRRLAHSAVRVWICCVCINQHRVAQARREGRDVDFDDFREAFGKRVENADHILALMAPWDSPVYLTRVWCIFELFTATMKEKDIAVLMPPREQEAFRRALVVREQHRVFEALTRVAVEDAEATVQADKESILRLIHEQSSSSNTGFSAPMRSLNRVVRTKLREWFVDTAAGFLEEERDNMSSPPAEVHNAIGLLLIEAMSDYPRAQRLVRAGIGAEPAQNLDSVEALTLIGIANRRMGNFESAHRIYREAQCMCEAIGATDTVEFAFLLRAIGTAYMKGGDPDLAIRYFMQSKDAYVACGLENTTSFASVQKHLGAAYGLRNNDKSDREAALRYYELARQTYESAPGLTTGPEYADLLNNLGIAYGVVGNLEKELQLYEESKHEFEKVGVANGPYIAHLLMNIGLARGKAGDHDAELDQYALARAAYEEIDAARGPNFALLLMNMGTAHGKRGDTDEELAHYQAARDAYQDSGINQGPHYADVFKNIGMVHEKRGKHSSALQNYKEADNAYRVCGLAHGQDYAHLLKVIGHAYRRASQIESARSFFRRAFSVYEAAGLGDEAEAKELRKMKYSSTHSLTKSTGPLPSATSTPSSAACMVS